MNFQTVVLPQFEEVTFVNWDSWKIKQKAALKFVAIICVSIYQCIVIRLTAGFDLDRLHILYLFTGSMRFCFYLFKTSETIRELGENIFIFHDTTAANKGFWVCIYNKTPILE